MCVCGGGLILSIFSFLNANRIKTYIYIFKEDMKPKPPVVILSMALDLQFLRSYVWVQNSAITLAPRAIWRMATASHPCGRLFRGVFEKHHGLSTNVVGLLLSTDLFYLFLFYCIVLYCIVY